MFPFVRFGSCKVREVGVCLRASVMPDWQEVCSAGQKSKQGQSGGRTGLLFLFIYLYNICCCVKAEDIVENDSSSTAQPTAKVIAADLQS